MVLLNVLTIVVYKMERCRPNYFNGTLLVITVAQVVLAIALTNKHVYAIAFVFLTNLLNVTNTSNCRNSPLSSHNLSQHVCCQKKYPPCLRC